MVKDIPVVGEGLAHPIRKKSCISQFPETQLLGWCLWFVLQSFQHGNNPVNLNDTVLRFQQGQIMDFPIREQFFIPRKQHIQA